MHAHCIYACMDLNGYVWQRDKSAYSIRCAQNMNGARHESAAAEKFNRRLSIQTGTGSIRNDTQGFDAFVLNGHSIV